MHATRVAVGTHAGEEVRVRMMHPGAWLPDDEAARPLVYLASMKSDPKIREVTTRPEIALLLHESPTGEEHTSWEMEITGRAEVVRDPAERERAKQATMRTSSIVRYLESVGQIDLLAFVRVTPRFMKHRVFGEIVAGRPPSILEFDTGADAHERHGAAGPAARRVEGDGALGLAHGECRVRGGRRGGVVCGDGPGALGLGDPDAHRRGVAPGLHQHPERSRRPAERRRRSQPHLRAGSSPAAPACFSAASPPGPSCSAPCWCSAC